MFKDIQNLVARPWDKFQNFVYFQLQLIKSDLLNLGLGAVKLDLFYKGCLEKKIQIYEDFPNFVFYCN